MLWTNTFYPSKKYKYYAFKGEEYFAEKTWTCRLEIERSEVFRILKFYENLPRFNSNGKLFWFGWLCLEWLAYDSLPIAALALMTIIASVFSFLATAITNLIIEPWPFELSVFHYVYTAGTQWEKALIMTEHYYGSDEAWHPFNKKRRLFSYLFGIKNYTDPRLMYVPVEEFISIEGESFMLSWIHTVLGLGTALKILCFLTGTVPTLLLLDLLISTAFKSTRKLAIMHKKLRV